MLVLPSRDTGHTLPQDECYNIQTALHLFLSVTRVLVCGRHPDHWFSGVSVLRHTGIVDALTEDGRLVVHVPHLHRQGLGGGELWKALVHGPDRQVVEALGLIVQRSREKQKTWRRGEKMDFDFNIDYCCLLTHSLFVLAVCSGHLTVNQGHIH